jgi:hypothetical protein
VLLLDRLDGLELVLPKFHALAPRRRSLIPSPYDRMSFQFTQARRAQSHLRIALYGAPGSGKTYSALRIAAGLGCQRIGVIDSERGKSRKQAGKGIEFGVLVLPSHSPRAYIEAFEAAAKAQIDGLIVDSLSHEWMGQGGALDMAAAIAKQSESGNDFTAWQSVSPEHSRVFDALLQFPGHVIATLRAKMAYEMVDATNRAGRRVQKPEARGLVPVQREGYAYELDVIGMLSPATHELRIEKSCCEAYPAGAIVPQPGAELGRRLGQWLRGDRLDRPEASSSNGREPRAEYLDGSSSNAREPRVEYDDPAGAH